MQLMKQMVSPIALHRVSPAVRSHHDSDKIWHLQEAVQASSVSNSDFISSSESSQLVLAKRNSIS